jgi:hypothetical protein
VGIYTSSLLTKQGVENRDSIVKTLRGQVEDGSHEEAVHSMLDLDEMYFSLLEEEEATSIFQSLFLAVYSLLPEKLTQLTNTIFDKVLGVSSHGSKRLNCALELYSILPNEVDKAPHFFSILSYAKEHLNTFLQAFAEAQLSELPPSSLSLTALQATVLDAHLQSLPQHLLIQLATGIPVNVSVEEERAVSERLLLAAFANTFDPSLPPSQTLVQRASLLTSPLLASDSLSEPLRNLKTLLDSRGDLEAVLAMDEALLASVSVSKASIVAQTRLDTLLALSFSSASSSLSYEEIADALRLDVDEVEMWLLDKIMQSCLDGRLNQTERVLILNQKNRDWRREEDPIEQTVSMLASIQSSLA